MARIDFDYLNADYPSLDPGLLLWSFVENCGFTTQLKPAQPIDFSGPQKRR